MQTIETPQDFVRAHQAALRMLSSEMDGVLQGVQEAARELPGPGGQAARLMAGRPGKLVRPLLVGLVHRALGGRDAAACARAAALVEVIHLSTLLHDDVVDEAPTRRGAPSAAAAVGNAAAVLGGDALVVHAIAQATTLGPGAVERTVHALQSLVTGELIQLRQRGNVSISPDEALHVAALKTGSLMRLSAELGALTAGRTVAEAVELGRAFVALGVGFQIADDVLDLSGDPSVVGKSVGGDVRQGTISHPLAVALQASTLHQGALARALSRGVSDERLGRVVGHVLARTRAFPKALRHAQDQLATVVDAVGALPVSRARTVLLAVCTSISQRAR